MDNINAALAATTQQVVTAYKIATVTSVSGQN